MASKSMADPPLIVYCPVQSVLYIAPTNNLSCVDRMCFNVFSLESLPNVQCMSDSPCKSRLVIWRLCDSTHPALSSILHGILPARSSLASMSGWMAEVADLVDAAQTGAQAPPMSKAARPQPAAAPSSIDDTPTEPATLQG